MDTSYDEDLFENPFFVEFKNEYPDLYNHCIAESWIMCIPRVGTLKSHLFTVQDFLAHILVPSEELPESHYSTLTEKSVTVLNKVLTLDINNSGLPLQAHILFEESFYTEDFIKYRVWCIETPLVPSSIKDSYNVGYESLLTLNDCITLLWSESAGRHTLESIENAVKDYLSKSELNNVAISSLRDCVGELYTQCLQIAFRNKRLKEKAKLCKQTLKNTKLAIETYMQHLIFDTIFKHVCTCTGYEDAQLNKIIRNLPDLQLRDLEVRKDIYDVVPVAKKILSKIQNYNTVMEKVQCMKKVFDALNKVNVKKDPSMVLAADDLLPAFVFLVIKTGIPNWYGQLTYMKEFRFSSKSKCEADETSFLITTLEAVIEHIKSGLLTGSPYPESHNYYDDEHEGDFLLLPRKRRNSSTESTSTAELNVEESLSYLFEQIKLSNFDDVKFVLEKNSKIKTDIFKNANGVSRDGHSSEILEEVLNGDDDTSSADLCHPLCTCRKCMNTVSRSMLQSTPTVNSRDSHGFTLLHISCMYGKPNFVDLLLSMSSEVNATDFNECTPLHYAASRGHQDAMFLLLHAGADLNLRNNEKNTPLHLAANNGHENCIKALIYYTENARKFLDINCVNDSGDTPLHLASKWGYGSIVRILIENGAEPSVENNKRKTAFDYAHNLNIMKSLKECEPNLHEYVHISYAQTNEKLFPNKANMAACSFVKNKDLELSNQNCPKQENVASDRSSLVLEDTDQLQKIERLFRAIAYGDIKLACFYMNFKYTEGSDHSKLLRKEKCHPLCECKNCIESSFVDPAVIFNINICNSEGNTPLHIASKYGSNELCTIMLNNGASFDLHNNYGQTPLHLATTHNRASTVQLLVSQGANINKTDIVGNTALHNAASMGYISVVRLLLNNNVQVNIVNNSERTAMDEAREKVHITIIEMLDEFCTNLNHSKS